MNTVQTLLCVVPLHPDQIWVLGDCTPRLKWLKTQRTEKQCGKVAEFTRWRIFNKGVIIVLCLMAAQS